MNALEFFEKHYKDSEYFEKFKTLFPGFYTFLAQIQVVPWQVEYQMADKNPHVITILEALEKLLDSGEISKEEFNRLLSEKFPSGIPASSKTLGISFISSRKVSFRQELPDLSVFLHECGHVYFEADDPVWSSTYGGAEVLMWLILTGKVKNVKDAEGLLKKHIYYLQEAESNPEGVGNELVELLEKNFKSKVNFVGEKPHNHLASYMLFSGVLPEGYGNYLTDGNGVDFSSWKYDEKLVRSFLINVIEGLRFNDPFCVSYFKAIFRDYLREDK